jgi:hypothetical protein
MSADHLAKLNGLDAGIARCASNQKLLPCRQGTVVKKSLPGCQRAQRHRRCFQKIEVTWYSHGLCNIGQSVLSHRAFVVAFTSKCTNLDARSKINATIYIVCIGI